MSYPKLSLVSLPYKPDAIFELFAPLSHLPWAILLHSGKTQHAHARYDILVADPIATLITDEENVTVVERQGRTERLSGDPLSILKRILGETLPTLPTNTLFPFQGGAMGYLSYDLVRCLETLPNQAQQDIIIPSMMMGIYDWAVIADHYSKTVTLLSLGDIKKRKSWLTHSQSTQDTVSPFMLHSDWISNMTREEYRQKFAMIQQYLLRGDCYQINLTQRFQANYMGDEWQAFVQLCQTNLAPFSAFLRFPEQAILSFSPERFISLSQNIIQTRPIKGTMPRDRDLEKDQKNAQLLAQSVKNKAENLMIVDLLRNDIGRVAVPGSVKVTELFTLESFPAVHHLVSTIIAQLPTQSSAIDLLRACFPGGSITGAPKIRAMQIIDELEPQRRTLYCGSIGYISCCGNMDTNIIIRTILANKGILYCWAGGGIVADSHEEEEYQESLHKLRNILTELNKCKR